MWWRRVLGAGLVLAVLGVAGGWAVGASRGDTPATIGAATPVPAASPAVPTVAATACAADPDDPDLGVDLPTASTHVSSGLAHGYGLSLDVPASWQEVRSGQNLWNWAPPGFAVNLYGLRVIIVAGQHQSVGVVEHTRIEALRSAVSEHNLADLDVESDAGDFFVATYVDDGFCRLTMERVLALGTTSAYVDLAVTGRLRDRQGLMDLLARTTASLVAG